MFSCDYYCWLVSSDSVEYLECGFGSVVFVVVVFGNVYGGMLRHLLRVGRILLPMTLICTVFGLLTLHTFVLIDGLPIVIDRGILSPFFGLNFRLCCCYDFLFVVSCAVTTWLLFVMLTSAPLWGALVSSALIHSQCFGSTIIWLQAFLGSVVSGRFIVWSIFNSAFCSNFPPPV